MDLERTTVNIFGQEYSVRGGADGEHVQRVAAYVDERMREVARSSNQVSSVRVAILAAMNIADELLRVRREGGDATALQAKAESMLESLEQELGPAQAKALSGDDESS